MTCALSVVLPAYNEEERIGSSLERVLAFFDDSGREAELVVVDDGSSDGTAEVVQGFASRGVRLVRLPRNRGKGFALKSGVAATAGSAVLISDADLSTPIAEIDRLEPHLGQAELVFGSRAASDARITLHQPVYRELMGKTFNLVLRLLRVTDLRDTQCGFKLLRGHVARELFAELTVERFAYDVELVWLAKRRGYRVVEVGVEWANSEATKVRAVRDSIQMLRDVIRLRLRGDGRRR